MKTVTETCDRGDIASPWQNNNSAANPTNARTRLGRTASQSRETTVRTEECPLLKIAVTVFLETRLDVKGGTFEALGQVEEPEPSGDEPGR